ncbi:MAG: MerR family transcriptional regulator [Thermoclostridium sp.]|nr:MerR family transcriptional regulator [Thermoclostridium sp.]
MKHYKTSEVAKLFRLHPNTIRLYEQWGLLPVIPRSPSGYRLFTQAHIDQIKLIRITMKCTMFGRAIKKTAYQVIQLAAEGNFLDALQCAHILKNMIHTECQQAEEAERFLESWASHNAPGSNMKSVPMQKETRKSNQLDTSNADKETIPSPEEKVSFQAAAEILCITPDTLRDWERNNLIHIPRNPLNGYREYGSEEINKLRVIRVLRRSNYSNMAILRAMQKLESGSSEGLLEALDNPELDAERGYLCFTDTLLTALYTAKGAVEEIISQLSEHT